jgi:hypothetical protein
MEFTGQGYARHYKLLKELEIKFPDHLEQQRIVAILDEALEGIATAAANAKKNLNNARELFESTLQSVFSNKREGWIEKNLEDLCNINLALYVVSVHACALKRLPRLALYVAKDLVCVKRR